MNNYIPTDPVEFDRHLSAHDWFYYMSDDHRVYTRGVQASDRLKAFTKSEQFTPELKAIYNKHHARCFNNDSFVSEKRPYQEPFPV